MSHSLPHLTLTTSTSSLSPIASTSPIFPTVSPSQTSPMTLNPTKTCDGPQQNGGSTQIPSLTGYEPLPCHAVQYSCFCCQSELRIPHVLTSVRCFHHVVARVFFGACQPVLRSDRNPGFAASLFEKSQQVASLTIVTRLVAVILLSYSGIGSGLTPNTV